MKKILPFIILCLLIASFLFLTVKTYAKEISSELSNNFFRLHILANSDSADDQALKLKVRDSIINYMNSQNFKSKDESIKYVQNNITKFYEIAEKVVKENGYDYKINIELGNFYFPTKYYGNISLPAGFYDGIKINIGEAKGQNWWCSLFPPLCFVDISSGVVDEESLELLENNLDKEEFNLITDTDENVHFKFKLIELLNHKNNNNQ